MMATFLNFNHKAFFILITQFITHFNVHSHTLFVLFYALVWALFFIACFKIELIFQSNKQCNINTSHTINSLHA
jgi:hypothetical protein